MKVLETYQSKRYSVQKNAGRNMQMKTNRSVNKKRKAATVLAVVLVVAMLLSLVAPFIGSVYGAQPIVSNKGNIGENILVVNNKDFKLESDIGFDQNLIVGKTAPFRLQITNTGSDFKGEVQIKINTYEQSEYQQGEYSIYYQPIELSKGASKQITMDVNVESISSAIKIGLVDSQGREVYSKMVSLNFKDPSTIAVGILTDNENGLQYLKGLNMAEFDGYDGVDYNMTTFFDSTNFPESSSVLQNFKMLIINDFDTKELSEKQLTALNEWTELGGFLIFGTGPNAGKVLNGLSSQVNLNLAGLRQIDSFTNLNDMLGVDISQYGPLQVAEITGEDLNPILTEGGMAISSSLNKGKGKIIIHNFDLALSPFTQLPIMTEMLRNLYIMEGTDIFDVVFEQSHKYSYLNSMANNIPPLQSNTILLIFGIIVIYIIFIGPVMYLLLKKKDKREKGWITIPLTAIIVTLAFAFISFSSPYKTNILSTIEVIDLNGASGPLEAKVAGVVKSPDTGQVTFASDSQIQLMVSDDYSYYYNSYRGSGFNQGKDIYSKKILCGEGTEITYFRNEKWGSNVVEYETEVELDGNIEGKITIKGDRFVGSVTNNTGYDLEDIVLSFGNRFTRYESLANGDTLDVDYKVTTESGTGQYYSSYDLIYDVFIPADKDLSTLVSSGQMSALEAHTISKRSDILLNVMDDITFNETNQVPISIYAFTKEKLSDNAIKINGKSPLEVNESIFFKDIPIALNDVDSFDIPYGFIQPSDCYNEEGANHFSAQGGFIYVDSGSGLECAFDLPDANIDLFQIKWEDTYEVAGDMFIFNNILGDWEPLETTEYTDVAAYRNEKGQILIRCFINANDEISVPQIRIKGGK